MIKPKILVPGATGRTVWGAEGEVKFFLMQHSMIHISYKNKEVGDAGEGHL
jgi:hypothetical protein